MQPGHFAGPHFGFEVILPVPGDSTDSALELYEGTTAIVCVLLIEPEEFKTIAEIIVQMSPGMYVLLLRHAT